MVEKRRLTRASSVLPIEICDPLCAGKLKQLLSKDISAGGLKIPYELPRNSKFPLKILFHTKDGPLPLMSRVAWNHGGNSGLQFLKVSGIVKKRLSGIVSEAVRSTRDFSNQKIPRLLTKLAKLNARKAKDISEDVIRLIYYKQYRMNKINLKFREVLNILELHLFHKKTAFQYIADQKLSECFGVITEDEALKRYEKEIGDVADTYGRKIIIDEEGMGFLYKGPDGGHTIDSKYFKASRAKRLPWIKFVIENTKEIYEVEDFFGVSYLYITKMIIPLAKEEHSKSTYFIVVVRKKKDKKLYFKTAYPVDSYKRFLKIIEPGRPYS